MKLHNQTKNNMTDKNDAAFARPASENNMGEYGLSKREYFAALALQGLLSDSGETYPMPKEISEWAVKYADALIDALNQEPEKK